MTDNVQFYVVIKHRNSIETWSTSAKSFSYGSLDYDFTSNASQAFGNNLKQIGTKWCIFSGDANQDGVIDDDDLNLINNDAYNFSSGYLSSDLTGDGFVDINDLIICDDNASAFVSSVIP